ncbi:MAG: TetR/AcrR family transcriptional regulator [Myxococcota bacterium]|nr:TetR/AcrR family transcriptional regulator [Myxococcota bacterium]
MPKQPREKEAVEAVKREILDNALHLIVQHGLEGFSMRKLASRLNIAAKTIYNYFQSKDEVYLHIIIKGFETLYEACAKAFKTGQTPLEQLEQMARAYLDFGLGHANFYNLMFTWHTPKYDDYVNTPLEPVARIELDISLKLHDLFVQAMTAALDESHSQTDPEGAARFYVIYSWSLMHGYIAGYHNTMLSYMVPSPEVLKEQILAFTLKIFKQAQDGMGVTPTLEI